MATDLGYETVLKTHVERERAAVKLASKVGELLYDKGIELVLFRNHLTDITISEILNLHEYAREVVNKPIDVFTTSELAEEILKAESDKEMIELTSSELFSNKDLINQIKEELKRLTNIAFEKDIFGAPTFIVNDKIFWGQDRLDYALEEYNEVI